MLADWHGACAFKFGRTGVGKLELDTVHAREQARWDGLRWGQKVRDAAARHEYGIIGGSWALSMAGAFGYIMRDRCVSRVGDGWPGIYVHEEQVPDPPAEGAHHCVLAVGRAHGC